MPLTNRHIRKLPKDSPNCMRRQINSATGKRQSFLSMLIILFVAAGADAGRKSVLSADREKWQRQVRIA